ncbi:hypothetical protein D3C74_131320 [compost metagenome]
MDFYPHGDTPLLLVIDAKAGMFSEPIDIIKECCYMTMAMEGLPVWIWIGSILLLLLIIIALLLTSVITVRLSVTKKNWDDSVIVDVKMLYGLITLHYEVPAIVLKSLQEGVWVEKSQSDNILKGHTSNEEQVIDQEKVHQWTKEFKEILSATKGLKKWMRNTLDRVTIRKLDWSTNIALSDAAHTATLTGVLWGVKSVLVGFLSYHVTLLQRPKIFVVPVFGSRPLFTTEIHCIAQIRCGYAIHAGLVLIVRVLKVKGGIRKWLSILFKA